MQTLCVLILVAVGLIHLLPVTGVLGGERLLALYGLRADEPSLSILLRHRAVLFALVGGLLIAGAFYAPWRGLALMAGLVSVLSFLWIATAEGGGNAALARVFKIDVVAMLALLIVLAHDVYRYFQR
ncbi:MAG TPA: hypothetical protein VGE57_12800 [Solimonas sp.]